MGCLQREGVDEELAALVWDRLRARVPRAHDGHAAVGLNPNLRRLLYRAGMKFERHYDGAFSDPTTRSHSKLSVQLYLNSSRPPDEGGNALGGTPPLLGGATRFLEHGATGVSARHVDVLPEAGMALVFEHNILHSGAEVWYGVKHAIRTDGERSADVGAPEVDPMRAARRSTHRPTQRSDVLRVARLLVCSLRYRSSLATT